MAKQGVGMKYDAGKLRVGLLLTGLAVELEEISAVLTYGEQKYAAHSWQTVPDGRGRYLDAAGRHILRLSAGEVFDLESGLRHVAHAITDLLFIAYLDRVDMEAADEYDTGDQTFREWLLTFNPPPTKG